MGYKIYLYDTETDCIDSGSLSSSYIQLQLEAIASAIITSIFANGQTLAVNGVAEFAKLIYKTNSVLPNGGSTPLGIDVNGNIGILNDLPPNFTLNRSIIENGLLQALASLTTSFNSSDIILKQDTLLTSALDGFAGTIWNSIKLADGSGYMDFYLNFINGLFRFYNHDGSTPAFVIDRDGSIGTGGVATSLGNPGHTAGDLSVPNGAGIVSNIAGSFGAFPTTRGRWRFFHKKQLDKWQVAYSDEWGHFGRPA